jgi:hypothetical protein
MAERTDQFMNVRDSGGAIIRLLEGVIDFQSKVFYIVTAGSRDRSKPCNRSKRSGACGILAMQSMTMRMIAPSSADMRESPKRIR